MTDRRVYAQPGQRIRVTFEAEYRGLTQAVDGFWAVGKADGDTRDVRARDVRAHWAVVKADGDTRDILVHVPCDPAVQVEVLPDPVAVGGVVTGLPDLSEGSVVLRLGWPSSQVWDRVRHGWRTAERAGHWQPGSLSSSDFRVLHIGGQS